MIIVSFIYLLLLSFSLYKVELFTVCQRFFVNIWKEREREGETYT